MAWLGRRAPGDFGVSPPDEYSPFGGKWSGVDTEHARATAGAKRCAESRHRDCDGQPRGAGGQRREDQASPEGVRGRLCIEMAADQGTLDKGWRGPWYDSQMDLRFVIQQGY